MAGDWIKMRGSLLTNPKVIRMARLLLQDRDFLPWFGVSTGDVTPSRDVTFASQSVTMAVTDAVTPRHVQLIPVVTRVTVGGLLALWFTVNECAANDGVLRGADLFEVDTIAGIPGISKALIQIGWLELLPNEEGVYFTNFHEHNTVGKERSTGAKTTAERAKEYRARKTAEKAESASRNVTVNSDASRDAVTTEKSREEKSRKKKGAKAPMSADNLPTWKQGLLDLYHEVLPELPSVRVMDSARDQALTDFRHWVKTTRAPDGQPRATDDASMLAWTRKYFELARANDFIMGRGIRSAEHKSWRCSIEYLLSSRGVKKVVEETQVTA